MSSFNVVFPDGTSCEMTDVVLRHTDNDGAVTEVCMPSMVCHYGNTKGARLHQDLFDKIATYFDEWFRTQSDREGVTPRQQAGLLKRLSDAITFH